MTKEFRKAFRKAAIANMREQAKFYRRFDGETAYLWPEELAFFRVTPETVWLVVIFSPHHSDPARFTVEVGWSEFGRFPELAMRPSAEEPKGKRSEHDQPEYVTRLATIVGRAASFWKIRSKADIPAVIHDVVEEVVAFGLPYLET